MRVELCESLPSVFVASPQRLLTPQEVIYGETAAVHELLDVL